MPRQYTDGGRNARGSFRTPQQPFTATSKSLKERVGALKNLRPFTVMVWRTSPQLTAASLVLRLLRALYQS
jgi:ATP-binding cassette, subfamily B, bacterial